MEPIEDVIGWPEYLKSLPRGHPDDAGEFYVCLSIADRDRLIKEIERLRNDETEELLRRTTQRLCDTGKELDRLRGLASEYGFEHKLDCESYIVNSETNVKLDCTCGLAEKLEVK